MNILHESDDFSDWLTQLKDQKAKARIFARLRAAKFGNFGDCKAVGDGVWEMRIHLGPGYRVYFAREGAHIYLLLLGGDKGSQTKDIENARKIWKKERKK